MPPFPFTFTSSFLFPSPFGKFGETAPLMEFLKVPYWTRRKDCDFFMKGPGTKPQRMQQQNCFKTRLSEPKEKQHSKPPRRYAANYPRFTVIVIPSTPAPTETTQALCA